MGIRTPWHFFIAFLNQTKGVRILAVALEKSSVVILLSFHSRVSMKLLPQTLHHFPYCAAVIVSMSISIKLNLI